VAVHLVVGRATGNGCDAAPNPSGEFGPDVKVRAAAQPAYRVVAGS
jgi:hypothetical protein